MVVLEVPAAAGQAVGPTTRASVGARPVGGALVGRGGGVRVLARPGEVCVPVEAWGSGGPLGERGSGRGVEVRGGGEGRSPVLGPPCWLLGLRI